MSFTWLNIVSMRFCSIIFPGKVGMLIGLQFPIPSLLIFLRTGVMFPVLDPYLVFSNNTRYSNNLKKMKPLKMLGKCLWNSVLIFFSFSKKQIEEVQKHQYAFLEQYIYFSFIFKIMFLSEFMM